MLIEINCEKANEHRKATGNTLYKQGIKTYMLKELFTNSLRVQVNVQRYVFLTESGTFLFTDNFLVLCVTQTAPSE